MLYGSYLVSMFEPGPAAFRPNSSNPLGRILEVRLVICGICGKSARLHQVEIYGTIKQTNLKRWKQSEKGRSMRCVMRFYVFGLGVKTACLHTPPGGS